MKLNLLASAVDAVSHFILPWRNSPNMVSTLAPKSTDDAPKGEDRRYLCECEAYFWMPATGPWYF